MPRAATTSDAFNAIAEPQRRRILTLLRSGEQPVNEVARALRIAQPRASKHLKVLREVGLVQVRDEGRQRLYALDARGLRPVRDWVVGFEAFWSGSFDRLEAYVRDRPDLDDTREGASEGAPDRSAPPSGAGGATALPTHTSASSGPNGEGTP